MKFNSRVTITGIKSSKGTLENGTGYDSTKVYVQTDLDDSKGTGKGSATVEYGWGLSTNYETVKHLHFPLQADVEMEIVTNGRTQRTQLVSLKPIKAGAGA